MYLNGLYIQTAGYKGARTVVFMTFRHRIFVVFVFDKILKGMLVTIEKELREYSQQLHF